MLSTEYSRMFDGTLDEELQNVRLVAGTPTRSRTRRSNARLDFGISASPTACPLRGHGRAGTQNDRLGVPARLCPRNGRAVGDGRRRCRDGELQNVRPVAGTPTRSRMGRSNARLDSGGCDITTALACIVMTPCSYGTYSHTPHN